MTISFKVSENTKEKAIEYFKDKRRDKTPAYAIFQADEEDTVVTLYESGSMVFQGVSADIDANIWKATERRLNPTKKLEEKKKKEFIQKVTGILYKYGDIESTPMLDKRIQDIYNEYYEEETDYVALKHKYNQYMLEREDEIKEHLKEAKNIKDYDKNTIKI